MAPKTILIIGGGIAGLAAGCYAQMNGYQSQIFERHTLPGGLCTAWERKDYIFDGCIHYLFGSGPDQPFHQLWRELGAVQDRQMIDHAEFMRVVDPDGRTLIGYADPDRLEEHLLDLAPDDAPRIRALAQGVRDFLDFDLSLLQAKPRSLMTGTEGLQMAQRMLPFVLPLARWGMLSARDFAARCRDPFLRRALLYLFGWPEIPMMAALSLLAYMHKGNAGFPTGGSLAFAQAIERRYMDLGGQIHYKAQVERILVENDRAAGVRLYDNAEVRGDVVISAADGHTTIFDMLDGRYVSGRLRRLYANLPILSQIQLSLGVDRDLSAEPHWVTYLLPEPITIAGEPRPELGVKHYCFDPSLAPPGKSVVEVMVRSDFDYWARLYGRREYDLEQLQEAESILAFLEQRYPGLTAAVEVKDVATPLSYERYTGNRLGSTCGWLPSKATMQAMLLGVSKTLPGLQNFYMAGQWVEPGGTVPLAALSGRNAIQLICAADGQPFTAAEPSEARVAALG
jgi:phytoene dehydrogenase-like protein